ncbi:unnamed protein product [Urochloa humidicola]
MWGRILHRYNLRRGSYPERTWRSLSSRWDIIKADVSKFSSFHADAVRENRSGMSDADKTTLAAANFADVMERNFGYMHCWNIMKDEPKWQDPKPRPSAGGAGNEEDTINLGDDISGPTRSDGKRPMGRDSAKAAKKKANSSASSTSSSEYASRMHDLSLQRNSIMQEEALRKNDRFQLMASIDEKRLACEEEKIRMMREKHDMEMQEKYERILVVDLDGCTPAQREYYEGCQQEIPEKMRKRRQAP